MATFLKVMCWILIIFCWLNIALLFINSLSIMNISALSVYALYSYILGSIVGIVAIVVARIYEKVMNVSIRGIK